MATPPCLISSPQSHGWKSIRADGLWFEQFVMRYTASARVREWIKLHGRCYVTFTFEESYKVTSMHGFAARPTQGKSLLSQLLHATPDAGRVSTKVV